MNEQLIAPMIDRLIAWADDELILAHRNSEWVSFAPMIEEDIAIGNFAQDELGHAMVLYDMVEALGGSSGDRLAFLRNAADFRNVRLVELPKGDWAFTILRQYLFDVYQCCLYDALVGSTYQPLKDVAEKIRKEEMYHLRHTHAWVERLGLGSDEANGRMQSALDTLYPLCAQLFVRLPTDQPLIDAEMIPDVERLRPCWEQIVLPHLATARLTVPTHVTLPSREEHSAYLEALLTEMQMVARNDPDAIW